jgi:hypothetical protein
MRTRLWVKLNQLHDDVVARPTAGDLALVRAPVFGTRHHRSHLSAQSIARPNQIFDQLGKAVASTLGGRERWLYVAATASETILPERGGDCAAIRAACRPAPLRVA